MPVLTLSEPHAHVAHPLRVALAAALVAFAFAGSGASSSAQAAGVRVGSGSNPHVSVGASGEALLTFSQARSPSDVLHFCKLPRGAKNCAARASFAFPNTAIDNGGYAFEASSGRILVLDSRCCVHYDDKYLYTSINGGRSFGPPSQIGADNTTGDGIGGAALYEPASKFVGIPLILTINSLQTLGSTFQATSTAPSTNAEGFSISNGDSTTSGDIAINGKTFLAAYTDQTRSYKAYWRRWNGTTDVNQSSSWSAPVRLAKANIWSKTQLEGGSGGIYAAYNAGATGRERWYLRRFNGRGFGSEVQLTGKTTGDAALAEAPSGRIYFAWRESTGALRLRWTTRAGGTGLSRTHTIGKDPIATDLAMAVGKRGKGWLTFRSGSAIRALNFKRP